jgi:hypothetical protein
MSKLTIILTVIFIIIFIIILFIWFMFWAFRKGLTDFTKPNKPSESIDKVKNFLGYDFGDEYSLIDHVSRNYHPDRPLTVTLKLSNEAFHKMLSYISNLDTTERLQNDEKNEVEYREVWIKEENGYRKEYSASREQGKYVFFIAKLTVSIENLTINYHETSI